MTDEQIIKALECCLCSDEYGRHDCCKCSIECGIFETEDDCIPTLRNATIDLIGRQKIEIENLKRYKSLYKDLKAKNLETVREINKSTEIAKSKAIKEFAEKLKTHIDIFIARKEVAALPITIGALEGTKIVIDNLAKEMMEDKENDISRSS